MNWLQIITFIVTTLTTAAPLIEQIIAEIQTLISSGQPVPASLMAQLSNMQEMQHTAVTMMTLLPASQLTAEHKALLATLKNA
jgi:hypothetical protein